MSLEAVAYKWRKAGRSRVMPMEPSSEKGGACLSWQSAEESRAMGMAVRKERGQEGNPRQTEASPLGEVGCGWS